MAININTASRNALLDSYLANYNNGYIVIYDGSAPADSNTALSGQVELATIPLNATAFDAAVAGSAALNVTGGIADSAADATGTATWCRIYDTLSNPGVDETGATYIIQGDVSTSGAFLNLDNTAIQVGGLVTITSMTLTHPA